MMFQKFFSIGIAVLLVVLSIWFLFGTGISLLHYYRLDQEAPLTISRLEVVEGEKNAFFLKAAFSFPFRGKIYQGEGHLPTPYPNPWAAEKAIAGAAKKNPSVWFNAKSPQSISFEKKFPLKKTLSALIVLLIAGYFLCLGIYVNRFEPK